MEEFAALLSPGDTIVDGGNANFQDSKRRHALLERARHQLRRRRHQRRHLGPRQRVRHDGRRRPRGGRAARADLHARWRRRGWLRPLRAARRRPLREDGPQRHRVRADAGLRRGLRDHARIGVPARPRGGRRGVDARHGHPLVAARAGRPRLRGSTARTSATSAAGWRTRARAAGRCRRRSTSTCPRRSSRSRCWPASASRQEESYSARVLAALRQQFGGHAVKER